MTDKVQKILSEIQTRKLCTMDEHMAFYNDNAKEDYRLLSEIEELIKALQEETSVEKMRDFFDTLEVKEVDLKEEFDKYTKFISAHKVQAEPFTQLYFCAKHFFELGLKHRKENEH